MAEPQNLVIELELTYLAQEIPVETTGLKPKKLLDIYVPESSTRPCIRLRKKDDDYEITKKKPLNDEDSSIQSEQSIPLDNDEFEALAITSQRRIEKNRFKVQIGDNTAEVDVFLGPLKGLVLIDFEFDSVEAMKAFVPPSCCLADVTQELFIAGGQLAGRSYSDIKRDLDLFKYIKL